MDFKWAFDFYFWLEDKGLLIIPIAATLFFVHFLKITFVVYSGKHKAFYIIITNIIISAIGCFLYILFRNIFTIKLLLWSIFLTSLLSCGLVDTFDSAIKWVQDKFFKKGNA